MPVTSPKTPRAVWDKVRIDYDAGNFTSVKELSVRYGINENTLNTRVFREKWLEQREMRLKQLQEKATETQEALVKQYLKRSYSRAVKYESLIDKTIAQCNEVLEPSDLDAISKTEMRTHQLACSSLRIPTANQVDVTSGGLSVEQNLVNAVQRLRDSGKAMAFTDEQAKLLSELPVIDDAGTQS